MLMYYHVGWHVGAFTLWNVCRLRIGFDAPPMSGFTRSRRIQPVNRTGDQLKHDRRGTRVGYKRINPGLIPIGAQVAVNLAATLRYPTPPAHVTTTPSKHSKPPALRRSETNFASLRLPA